MLPSVGYTELLFLAVIAVLLFGKKLPEVAKSIGKGYGKIRRSLSDVQKTLDVSDQLRVDENEHSTSTTSTYDYDEYDEPTAPKFDPPPSDQ